MVVRQRNRDADQINTINKMNKKAWIVIIAEALVFILLLGITLRNSNERIETLENNIKGYRDDIAHIEMQNGELTATKQSLILSESQARDELEITKKEMKELKKKLGNDLAYIANLESQIGIRDTIWMQPDTVYIKDSTQFKQFHWTNKWTRINATVIGRSVKESDLTINALHMDVPLQIGFTDDYRFWAKSSNPLVTFTDIEAVVIDDSVIHKKQRIQHGIHIGFGIQYGLFGQQWDFGPQAGYSMLIVF